MSAVPLPGSIARLKMGTPGWRTRAGIRDSMFSPLSFTRAVDALVLARVDVARLNNAPVPYVYVLSPRTAAWVCCRNIEAGQEEEQ